MDAAAQQSNTGAGSATTVADTAPAKTNASSTGSTATTAVTSALTPPAASTPPAQSTPASITFSWVPPTQNSDGSPITNLAGYKLHYGKSSTDYTQTLAVENAGLTRFVVDNLPSGTYYFAITAFNAQGLESPLSGEITARL
jgi:fibronectin type III domain protein